MSFVDFMIIGAMKSGTTTLSQILSKHPDVCFCKVKEPHFFSKNPSWENNISDYRALYSPKNHQICGEASTTYTCYPEFNQDIWNSLYKFNPKLKLIYIMRDPVDRIVSHWMHMYLRGYTSETFENIVLQDPSYINRTRYYMQIRPYLENFGQEQVLLLSFEEFINNQSEVCKRITDFLSIDYSFEKKPEQFHANVSVGKTKRNIMIDQIKSNHGVKLMKKFFPNNFKIWTYKNLHKLTERKIDQRPIVSNNYKEIIWNLLYLDIENIEKIMGRKLIEWKSQSFHNISDSSVPQSSLDSL